MSPLTRDELRSRRAVRRQADRHQSNRVMLTVVAPALLVAVLIAAVVLAFYDGGADTAAQPATGQLASPVPPTGIGEETAPQRVVLARAGQHHALGGGLLADAGGGHGRRQLAGGRLGGGVRAAVVEGQHHRGDEHGHQQRRGHHREHHPVALVAVGLPSHGAARPELVSGQGRHGPRKARPVAARHRPRRGAIPCRA